MRVLFIHVVTLCCIFYNIDSFRLPYARRLLMVSSKTEEYFKSTEKYLVNNQAFGAGASSSLAGLKSLDNGWKSLKSGGWKLPPKPIVYSHGNDFFTELHSKVDFDVAVSGGTLGLFYAIGLLQKGYKVCIIERGKIAGRSQEWNISEKELRVLIRLNIITEQDMEKIKSIKFNPARVGFKLDTRSEAPPNGYELYVEDILNLGIRPDILISILKEKFIRLGGTVFEDSAVDRVDVYNDSAIISKTTNANCSSTFSCKLLIDSMGNASPISRQTRGNVEPDGICIVVGSCAQGYNASNNTYSDIIYTDSPITAITDKTNHSADPSLVESSQLQYFWEAFPAGSGKTDRTTYLFTYMDAKPERPSVADIFDDYWRLLPRYQGVNLDELQFIRFLYGVFPTYRASPIQTTFNRILAVGDASGIQSPLSFGGFGSLTRHIERVLGGVDEALTHNLLECEYINTLNPYQPNLGACWMFQRAMSVPVGRRPNSNLIVNILSNSFRSMDNLGMATIKPFLQDVLQFYPLLRTLMGAAVTDPLTPLKIVPHVGVLAKADFLSNFAAMFAYTICSSYVTPIVRDLYLPTVNDPGERFKLKRLMEAWKFGSGLDYDDHDECNDE